MKKNLLIATFVLFASAVCFGKPAADNKHDAGKSIYQAR